MVSRERACLYWKNHTLKIRKTHHISHATQCHDSCYKIIKKQVTGEERRGRLGVGGSLPRPLEATSVAIRMGDFPLRNSEKNEGTEIMAAYGNNTSLFYLLIPIPVPAAVYHHGYT